MSICRGVRPEWMATAGMRRARRRSTWSFIRAMSGVTTMQSPSRVIVGTWYVSDLPPPVGISASVSRPASTERMISSCTGRNSPNPQ